MNASDLGVVPPESKQPIPPVEPPKPGTEKPTGDNTPPQNAGTDKPQLPPQDDSKRINDLMSKWQTEESAHKKTQTELDHYRTEYEKIKNLSANKPEDANTPSFLKPDWEPQNFQELGQAIREAMELGERNALGKLGQERQNQQQAEAQIDAFVKEVKTADPEFDEDEFYGFANKHRFPAKDVNDLRSIYSAYFEHREAVKSAKAEGAKNAGKRAEEPVHAPGSGGGEPSTGIPYSKIQGARSVIDAAMDAFRSKK